MIDILIKILLNLSYNNKITIYSIILNNNRILCNRKDHVNGDLIVNVNIFEDPNFEIINDKDLHLIRKISLSQFLYGGKINIIHLDGEILPLQFDSCLEKKPIFTINNKGIELNNIRGNLCVYLKIEGINSEDSDPITSQYKKVLEETIKLMFPPIDN